MGTPTLQPRMHLLVYRTGCYDSTDERPLQAFFTRQAADAAAEAFNSLLWAMGAHFNQVYGGTDADRAAHELVRGAVLRRTRRGNPEVRYGDQVLPYSDSYGAEAYVCDSLLMGDDAQPMRFVEQSLCALCEDEPVDGPRQHCERCARHTAEMAEEQTSDGEVSP